MPSSSYKTKEAVLLKGREAIGIPFEKIDKSNKLKEAKGGIGKMIEADWFDIENNNTPEPDFKEAGVELKVTPYFYNSRGLRAKERLVCNIINYEKENINNFYESSFWKKNENILLMSYHDTTPEIDAKRKKNKEEKLTNDEKYELKKKFKIDEVALFKIPDRDLATIINDWSIIAEKIKNGEAHELSEKQTMYLAACTKGNNAESSMRKQRGNNVKARERAYSLKPSYMTYILNTFLYGKEEDENIIKDVNLIKVKGIEEYIIEKIKPYYGRTQAELKSIFNVNSSAKSLNRILISKILEVDDVENSAEFKKAGIRIKTIRVESNGESIEQHMSFPVVKFLDIVNESWDDSMTKELMVDTKYMFAIFKKDKYYNDDKYNSEHTEKHLILNNIVFWQLPENDEEEVKKVWSKARKSIIEGAGLKKIKWGKNYRITNTLPKQSQSKVAHMRPHTTKSGYTAESPYADMLPNGKYMTKQCFWFNREYILKQIKEYIL
ncbi:Sau3AI family type II restriction endonuclease [Clostridium perfringens]